MFRSPVDVLYGIKFGVDKATASSYVSVPTVKIIYKSEPDEQDLCQLPEFSARP